MVVTVFSRTARGFSRYFKQDFSPFYPALDPGISGSAVYGIFFDSMRARSMLPGGGNGTLRWKIESNRIFACLPSPSKVPVYTPGTRMPFQPFTTLNKALYSGDCRSASVGRGKLPVILKSLLYGSLHSSQ